MDLPLKRAKLSASTDGGDTDTIIRCTATWRRESRGWGMSELGESGGSEVVDGLQKARTLPTWF